MRRFRNCDYGPMTLRRVLRPRLAPGERLIGWGAAERPQTQSSRLLSLIVGMTPGIGLFLAPAIGKSETLVLVLTDRRLFVGPPRMFSRGLGSGRWRSTTLERLGVRRLAGRKGQVQIAIEDRMPPTTLEVLDRNAGPSARLWAALCEMSLDEDVLGASPPEREPDRRRVDDRTGDWIV